MFGYVKANTPELKVKEYELYRAAYCGVCRAMGRCTGQCSRLTLTWDAVFLFFLRTALTRAPFEIERHRCVTHWIKPRKMIVATPELDAVARTCAVTVGYKLRDDRLDERGAKRFAAWLAVPFADAAMRRAALPALEAETARLLDELHEIERAELGSFDRPAELSGRLTAALFAEGLPADSAEARLAADVGYHVGKIVYAADAADDFADDRKRGRYNPYRAAFGCDTLGDAERAVIRDAVRCECDAVCADLALMDFSGIDGIRAILYNTVDGMMRRVSEILDKGKEQR